MRDVRWGLLVVLVCLGVGHGVLRARAQPAEDPPPEAAAPAAEPTEAPADDTSGQAPEADAEPAAAAPAPGRRLRVGVAGSPPFVFRHDGRDPVGPAVEIWEAIAQAEGWQYELVSMPSAQGSIDAVEAGEIDVAIGPISITARRANQVAFTQPYWQADLAIMSVPSSGGLLRNPRILKKLGKAVGVLAIALTLVGLLMWVAERKEQEFKGFGDAFWFALVTMTTVGYGDLAPKTRFGRIIAGLWMLFAMVFGASLTAQIATALTLAELGSSSISSADDLRRRTVATKEGSTALDFVTTHHGRPLPTPDLEAAVAELVAGHADAVVFDRPALRYQQSLNPDANLLIAEAGYEAQGYGFAFHSTSPLRRAANVALLAMHEEGRLEQIGNAWISGERSPDD